MNQSGVLAIDLDHTLIKTDMLYESLWHCISQDSRQLAHAALALPTGRARFKQSLSRQSAVDVAQLPYNQPVLDYVRAWREVGGRTVLVTASDQSVARRVADHLGMFDEVFGSDGSRNLKGDAKAAFLAQRYGAGRYDYIGDSFADLPVWRWARRAISADAPDGLRRRIVSEGGETLHLGTPNRGLGAYLRAMRPHQWSKNLLIFLPLIAAHEACPWSWLGALAAFIAFCLIASSVYVLNDLLDLAADRAHPRKRNRPLASGALPLAHGMVMVPALLLAGLLASRIEFLGLLGLYYLVTLGYSFFLKRRLLIDIYALAGLYTIRILAGAAAAGVPLSAWLLGFSAFLFVALAAVKRLAELSDLLRSGGTRASGRAYRSEDRPAVLVLAITAGGIAVLILACYLASPSVDALYRHPALLWPMCAVLLYWIARMIAIAQRGPMDDDPIAYAMRDRISHVCAGLMSLLLVGASLP